MITITAVELENFQAIEQRTRIDLKLIWNASPSANFNGTNADLLVLSDC